jgi:taurine--2-oxoglutarate transaminase
VRQSDRRTEKICVGARIPGFIKFFDPYIYREGIEFSSEEAATAYYLAKLREQICYEGPDSIAAIVMETVTGSNGVILPPKGYLPGIRKLCDEFGIVMILDEVMTAGAVRERCLRSRILMSYRT